MRLLLHIRVVFLSALLVGGLGGTAIVSLVTRHPRDIGAGVFAALGGLVDVGGADLGRGQAQLTQKLATPRAGRSEDELHLKR